VSPRAAVRSGILACAVVPLLLVAGCGDDADPYAVPDRFEDYCDEVKAQQLPLGADLEAGGSTTGLIKALPRFEALEDAGVDPASYDRRHPPAGLDREHKEAIDAAATSLVSATTGHAMSSVQQHARDVCKTPLTL
jgi:hypothetical protein